jgi:hypothetical protein
MGCHVVLNTCAHCAPYSYFFFESAYSFPIVQPLYFKKKRCDIPLSLLKLEKSGAFLALTDV